MPRWGTLVGLFFGPVLPHDFTTACTTDEAPYARFFHALLDEGVAIAPGAYEVMFPGLAHDDAVLARDRGGRGASGDRRLVIGVGHCRQCPC